MAREHNYFSLEATFSYFVQLFLVWRLLLAILPCLETGSVAPNNQTIRPCRRKTNDQIMVLEWAKHNLTTE